MPFLTPPPHALVYFFAREWNGTERGMLGALLPLAPVPVSVEE